MFRIWFYDFEAGNNFPIFNHSATFNRIEMTNFRLLTADILLSMGLFKPFIVQTLETL